MREALAMLLVLLIGCGRDAEEKPLTRIRPAGALALLDEPRPSDTQLRIQYSANALLVRDDPVARVDVQQTARQVVVRLYLRERIPDPDETVPNYALILSTTVTLASPVGSATVLDGNRIPPARIRLAENFPP